jgi:hypothetical protein
MKTMTTLTAVAALIAGISFASAQMSPSPRTGPAKATGNSPFCSTVSKTNGSLNCKYASMAACEKDAQAQGLQCQPNPGSSTTGSKN